MLDVHNNQRKVGLQANNNEVKGLKDNDMKQRFRATFVEWTSFVNEIYSQFEYMFTNVARKVFINKP